MKKILLADDYSIVRSGLKSLIEEICHQVQIDETGNETGLMKFLKTRRYDLVMLDIGMPGVDFANLLNWIKLTFAEIKLLIFSMHPEEIYGVRCLQMGAMGYLRKTAPNDEIILAIRKVMDGKKYISTCIAELLLDTSSKHKTENPFTSLSARELEIVKHLNDGMSLPGICEILKIQYSTVNTYKRRVFEKLNVHTTHSLSQLMKSFDM